MSFRGELDAVLPCDLPHRDTVVEYCAKHLDLIAEANRQFNLTRIVSPREAAIKHVLDAVIPWKWFAGGELVLDVGTGAGYPGIPLAATLPDVSFVLCDSTGKKTRFVAEAVALLGLRNVQVVQARGEEWLKGEKPHVITGRAVTPLGNACALLGPAVRRGSRGLLYKGPDAQSEIAEAGAAARKQRVSLRVVERYDLPDALGSRTLVEMAAT